MTVLCGFLTGVFAIVLLFVSIITCTSAESSTKPNIVLIVADDLGWDDVSFHGSDQTLTPNIDMLAYTGVALGRYYTHCVCTPSRAALLSGKFAHTLGMHGYPLTAGENRGLPLSEKLLPEYLKELGYATHLVGKWHLGQSRDAYLPTSRGFDSHFGYRGGAVDYYEYVYEESDWIGAPVTGFDLYRNLTPAWDIEGYMTDVLTNEAKNAMMKKLDDSVGEIIRALSDNELLNNTIIVFISDNGGMPLGISANYASNWPLRGSKFTPFEGGIRATALLWTPTSATENHLWNGYIHVVDWLPTLLGAIGADIPPKIDGINLWNDINSNRPSRRRNFFEIYTYGDRSFSSITFDDYKLIVGNITKENSRHLGGNFRGIIGEAPSYSEAIKNSNIYSVLKKIGKYFNIENISLRNNIKINCNHIQDDNEIRCTGDGTSCLFNIKEDPCERRDLSRSHAQMAAVLLSRLQLEMTRGVDRPFPLYADSRASPSLHNFTWTTWANYI